MLVERNKSKASAPNSNEIEAKTKLTQQEQGANENGTPAQKQPATEIELVKRFAIDCLIYLIKFIIATFDLISQPIYYYKHDVAKRRREVDHLRSRRLRPDDPEAPWRQMDIEPAQLEIERAVDSYETYDELMKQSFLRHQQHPCYGYRQVLEESWQKRPDNPDKLVRQVKLSDYKWCSYGQFESQIEAARLGLLRDGVRAGQRVILFADTRAEWQICSQALIRLGAVVGTMYSTLGIDGIVHTVNETEAELVVTQRDKVGRLLKLAHRLPKLKRIVYFETSLYLPLKLGGFDQADELKFLEAASGRLNNEAEWRQIQLTAANQSTPKLNGDLDHIDLVECSSFCTLLKSGLEMEANEGKRLESLNNQLLASMADARKKNSLAVIMYTSGSTGIPKGVLISHGNIMATLKSFSYVTKDFISNPRENTCTAYLPLAHIFEFCIESVMLYHGVRFGFASPQTLTDKSPGLAPGQVGDLSKLKPTVMIIVPLILDRIVQGVKQALKALPYFKEQLVGYLIDYKIYWQKRHYETPLVDKIVCSKMAVALGGRAKYVICGSAPLSSQTQTYVRAALNIKLPQGFGTTETCAATACQLFDDQSTSNVGLPVSGAQIKLEPWLEGNYRPSDKPNPRGEIVVGGEMIANGYYKMEEQTREAFYVDSQGTRWYRTGDIGEFLPNGQLKIIDRKKDLVKLQNGEYISLGRVESTLKSNPFTDNFCIYANSNFNYVIALGPANEAAIKTLAQQIVDESGRKLTPTMMKRLANGANSNNHQSQNNSTHLNHHHHHHHHHHSRDGSPRDSPLAEERETLLMSEDERQHSLDELKEVLESYENDLLNNNINNERRESHTSPNGQLRDSPNEAGPTQTTQPPAKDYNQRNRADSNALPLSSCLNERLNRLCQNRLITERVLEHIHMMAKERNLLSLEIPKKLLLLAEDWTEDKNLVTAALKIRRNYVYRRYERELDHIYAV